GRSNLHFGICCLQLFKKVGDLSLQPDATKLIDEYNIILEQYNDKDSSAISLNEAIKRRSADSKSLQENISSIEKMTDDLFSDYPEISTSNKNKILDFVSELDVLEQKFGPLRFMTEIPNEILTVVVVIFMGMLGSTVCLLQRFQQETESTWSFYILRQF